MNTVSDLIQSATATAMASASVEIGPSDKRCRYWAKVLRAGCPLPAPSAVNGANDVPGPYLRHGDEELFPGDVLIEGEALHHRKARGWLYTACFMGADGAPVWVRPSHELKATMKAAGMPAHLLAGSGDVAACVRIAHAVRLGIDVK
jgi:hypothetical protein